VKRSAAVPRLGVAVALAVLVLAVFSPALGNGFVGYDDPDYVTANPYVQAGLTGRGLVWSLTALHAGNWHPLTWASHMLDVTLYGLDPRGHHLTSVLLHLASTVLLFLLLDRDTGRTAPSAFAAAVFGVHPLHVESVAWVAERKDVLSALFWLLMMLAYGACVRGPRWPRFALVMMLFAAGLASKPMVVTLPLVLLLWDVWPLGRWPQIDARTLLREKAPLLALSMVAAAMTLRAQAANASVALGDELPVGLRFGNALASYVWYCAKAVWPVGLAAFYPYPMGGIGIVRTVAALSSLAAITGGALASRRRRPWLTVGWLWYLVTLLPVIGLVQVGMQAMADRYLYLPMIGLLVAIGWTADEWAQSRTARRALAAGAVLSIAALGILTWRQIHVWRDGVTLWTHALKVTKGNYIAHDNLGVELDARGRAEEALAQYRETLRLKPGDRHGESNYAMATFAKGERLASQGDLEAALALFKEGLRYRPDNAAARAYVEAIEERLRSGTTPRPR
jgi:tetratricopeptide (TPR) repeat protein